jgi:antitoxin (DNA-binding transcriptional repressor) of toxin-antitoxin stability system
MHTVTLKEAQARLPDLVKEAGKGEEIVIMENDKAVATLAAPPADEHGPKPQGWPVIGMMKGGIEYREGWDETPEGFEPYMP